MADSADPATAPVQAPADSKVIKLDCCFLSFEINGQEFSVDVWDAGDLLASQVDVKHANDPKGCQDFLDSVIALLKEKWGVPRCSRRGAWQFYAAVTGKMEELKKTILPTPESDTGSDSTPEAGQNGLNEPDSKTSTDATPSEICASLT